MPQYLNVFSWGIIHSWAISYCIYSVRPNRNKCIAMDTFPESYLFSGTKKVEVIRLSNPGALHALWNTSQMFVRTRIDPFLFFSFLLFCFCLFHVWSRSYLLFLVVSWFFCYKYILCFPLFSAIVFCVSRLFYRYFDKFGIPFSLVSLSDVFLFCPVACLPFQNSRVLDSSSGFDHLVSDCQCQPDLGFLWYGFPLVWSSPPPVCPFTTGYYFLTYLDLTCLTFPLPVAQSWFGAIAASAVLYLCIKLNLAFLLFLCPFRKLNNIYLSCIKWWLRVYTHVAYSYPGALFWKTFYYWPTRRGCCWVSATLKVFLI